MQLSHDRRQRGSNLVLMTWTLAVFSQRFQRLVDEGDVSLGDVETEQPESTGRTATDAVEELQRLTDDVVVGLVAL